MGIQNGGNEQKMCIVKHPGICNTTHVILKPLFKVVNSSKLNSILKCSGVKVIRWGNNARYAANKSSDKEE